MNRPNENDDENAWERLNAADPAGEGEATTGICVVPRKSLPASLRRILNNEPHEVTIDYYTLRRLMQRHNQAVALLREFLALHPVETDLTQRTRCLVDNPE